MLQKEKYLATTVLVASMIFGTVAEAMPTAQFDKLSRNDQEHYVTQLAIGTVNALYDAHDIQGGDTLKQFFDDSNTKTGGFGQFYQYLNTVRIINAQNAQDPKNTKHYDVEYAMLLLMKNNGIKPLPIKTLLAINKDFKSSETNSPSVTETNKP